LSYKLLIQKTFFSPILPVWLVATGFPNNLPYSPAPKLWTGLLGKEWG